MDRSRTTGSGRTDVGGPSPAGRRHSLDSRYVQDWSAPNFVRDASLIGRGWPFGRPGLVWAGVRSNANSRGTYEDVQQWWLLNTGVLHKVLCPAVLHVGGAYSLGFCSWVGTRESHTTRRRGLLRVAISSQTHLISRDSGRHAHAPGSLGFCCCYNGSVGLN